MSETPYRCYYYDEQHNRCKCYDNENLNELLAENAKLRKLLSIALIGAGFKGRQYLDTYLREEEDTALLQKLKDLGIEADA